MESENHEVQHVLRAITGRQEACMRGILSRRCSDVWPEKRVDGDCTTSRVQPSGKICPQEKISVDPEYTREFLISIPLIEFGVPAFLLALNAMTDRKDTLSKDDEWTEPGAEK